MSIELTTVRELMSTELITISRHTQCDVAIELMSSNDVRRLPVVSEGNRLIGIITLNQAELALPTGSSFWSEGEGTLVPPVSDVMTDFVYTIKPDQSVGRAAQLMAVHKIGALPVIEEGKLVGILTESDLFRFLADQMPDPEPAPGPEAKD
jgi:CBS domain-containing protein